MRNQLATRPSVEMEKKFRCLDTWRTEARSVQRQRAAPCISYLFVLPVHFPHGVSVLASFDCAFKNGDLHHGCEEGT